MCSRRVGAHDGSMFTSYEMTKAFVAERQETLRHEARQHHLGRGRRRGKRSAAPRRAVAIASPVELPSRATRGPETRMAA